MSTATTGEVEEERRLLYVAMTRAKEELSLLLPQRFHVHQQAAHGDRHVYASRTRFIPDALTALFERCSWPEAAPPADATQSARDASPPVDLAARIRAAWR
jgi:DNA helicase-2/ATP-dependent DNA helicase PcrA